MRILLIVFVMLFVLFTLDCYVIQSDVDKDVRPRNCTFLLTVDDGPNSHTAKIYNYFEAHNYLAVFFMTGDEKRLDKYYELQKRIIESGHIIGNHTKSHDLDMLRTAPFNDVYDNIYFINDYYLNRFNYEVTLFRPPYGKKRRMVLPKILDMLHMQNVLWTIDLGYVEGDSQKKGICYRHEYNVSCLSRIVLNQLNMMPWKRKHIILLHSRCVIANNIASIISVLKQYGSIVRKKRYITMLSSYKYDIKRRNK